MNKNMIKDKLKTYFDYHNLLMSTTNALCVLHLQSTVGIDLAPNSDKGRSYVTCFVYTDEEEFNKAADCFGYEHLKSTDIYVLMVVNSDQGKDFIIYIKPDRKDMLINLCLTLFRYLKGFDDRFSNLSVESEVKLFSDFYNKLLLQFGVVL